MAIHTQQSISGFVASQPQLTTTSKGDNILAEGYVRPVNYEREGQPVESEEFVAKRIGHDMARTRYDVDRTPRQNSVQESLARDPAPAQRTSPAIGL